MWARPSHRHAVPVSEPPGTLHQLRGHPEYLLPDALPRVQRRRLFQYPQRGRRIRRACRAAGMTSSASSTRSTTCRMLGGDGTVQNTHAICEAAICYTGDILDERGTNTRQYYVRMARELKRMGAHFWRSRTCRVCRLSRAQAGQGAQGGDWPAHYFHTHDTAGSLGQLLQAGEAGARRGPRMPHVRQHHQPNLNSIVAASSTPARYAPDSSP